MNDHSKNRLPIADYQRILKAQAMFEQDPDAVPPFYPEDFFTLSTREEENIRIYAELDAKSLDTFAQSTHRPPTKITITAG